MLTKLLKLGEVDVKDLDIDLCTNYYILNQEDGKKMLIHLGIFTEISRLDYDYIENQIIYYHFGYRTCVCTINFDDDELSLHYLRDPIKLKNPILLKTKLNMDEIMEQLYLNSKVSGSEILARSYNIVSDKSKDILSISESDSEHINNPNELFGENFDITLKLNPKAKFLDFHKYEITMY